MEKIINKKAIKLTNNYIINKIIKNIEKNKIISVSGVNGSERSELIIKILKLLKNNKKILIINMDFFNNYLFEYAEEEKNNIYYFNGIELIYAAYEFENNIQKLKEKYDVIIINSSHESFFDCNRLLIEESNKNYFIINNNNSEISRSNYLYNMYIDNWKINDKKIDIILN